MNRKYKECSGCAIINKCTIRPSCIYEAYTVECPCLICIIKTMCTESCKLYNEYCKLYDAYSFSNRLKNRESSKIDG